MLHSPGFFSLVVFLLLLVAVPASAGHYMIADVPDVIGVKHHKALSDAGVADTKVLYERIVTRKARRALAAKTGIPARRLTRWARFLDLMQINGIGPKMVHLFNAAGVDTLKELQKQVGADLQPKMRAANAGAKHSELVPSPEVVAEWIKMANQMTVRLQ